MCTHPLHRSLRSRGFPLIPGGSVVSVGYPLHRSLRSRGFPLIPGGSEVSVGYPLHRSLRSRGFPLIPGGSVVSSAAFLRHFVNPKESGKRVSAGDGDPLAQG